MAQSLITFAVAFASVAFADSSSAKCNSYGVDFQNGGSYFQNNASSDPFTAFQQFTGCQNDTAGNVLVDPQGNQAACSYTPMQPNKQVQLITCSDNPKDTLYSGNWSLLVISNNGNADPIAYQRDFSLDVGAQSTTYVYPTVTVSQNSTTVATSTKETTTTITSVVPKTTVTATHNISSTVTASASSSAGHGPPGWTDYPHPSYIKSTKTMTTYTATVTDYRISASVHYVEAQCTAPTAEPYQDKGATIVPSVLGELDNVAKSIVEGTLETVENTVSDVVGSLGLRDEGSASAQYKRAIIAGREPTDEEKRGFVAEREARMARREVIMKRHPDNKTVTSTATQFVTSTIPGLKLTTLTETLTNTDTTTTTISSGTATVYQNETVPVTTTAPASTFIWTVTQPFAFTETTVTSVHAITNTITTTAPGAWASCAHEGKYMH